MVHIYHTINNRQKQSQSEYPQKEVHLWKSWYSYGSLYHDPKKKEWSKTLVALL